MAQRENFQIVLKKKKQAQINQIFKFQMIAKTRACLSYNFPHGGHCILILPER